MAPLTLKTPGVYIQELNAFTNSIVPVQTAVPVFIGYTEKAEKGTESLHMVPTKITSMKEFEDYFGGAPTVTFGLIPVEKAPTADDIAAATNPANTNVAAIAGTEIIDHTFKPSKTNWFILHNCMQMFYDNGGADCFVLSVKTYKEASSGVALTDFYNLGADPVVNVFAELELFTEPTMVVIPEAALMLTYDTTNKKLEFSGSSNIQVQSLAHCAKMQTCFSIMDVPKGYLATDTEPYDPYITDFQNGIGINDLKWGAAYFPWLHTNVTPSSNLTFLNIEPGTTNALLGAAADINNFFTDTYTPIAAANIQGPSPTARTAAKFETPFVTSVVAPLKPGATPADPPTQFTPAELATKSSWTLEAADLTTLFPPTSTKVTTITVLGVLDKAINEQFVDQTSGVLKSPIQAQKLKNALLDMTALIGIDTSTWNDTDKASFQSTVNGINNMLYNSLPAYKESIQEMADKLNLLPPSAAMAGLYTMTDHQVGVWKAPANVSVADALKPAIHIGHFDQEDLNVPLNGKAINAIRFFNGKGVIVWGARTLDGNSQDWRYINVKRTLIFIEQSIKVATEAFVFEANDAQTWGNLKSMISQFLTSVWAQGGLAGAKASDAFSVACGLGTTMTAEDILNGRLNVMVKVAVSHPAEFIVITVQQQLQKS